MRISNKKIEVHFDKKNGNTIGIFNPQDPHAMNWVLNHSKWGVFGEYEVKDVTKTKEGICVSWESVSQEVIVIVEKRLVGGLYQERYTIVNQANEAISLTKDNFGLIFPYDCVFGKKDTLNHSCITHVWCGGDVTWMYSAKPNGEKSYLVCYCEDGSFSDYSINYDVTRVSKGCDYRGDIVLHMTECMIKANEQISFTLNYTFSSETPDTAPVGRFCKARISANKYTAFLNEKVSCIFETTDVLSGVEILVNGEPIDYVIDDNLVKWTLVSEKAKEMKVCARWNGKETWMFVNILESLDVILHKRAKFITERQQCHEEGSPLDGAYLIYDRVENKLVCSAVLADHNACRERLSMGTVVALALQYKYDDFMMKSLKKHREFIEREVFDADTGIVYNEINKDNTWHRAYNYFWMADYYLEWYKLTGEQQCILYAARIMMTYYDKANGILQVSPCMRMTDICKCLEHEKLLDLRQELIQRICSHADYIIKEGDSCYSEEVSCTQGMFIGKVDLLCQAYLLSGNKEYLSCVPNYLEKSDNFSARQPDYHTNDIAVRYWDLFWFGKIRIYGDTMPQWLGAWAGEIYSFVHQCGFGNEYFRRMENNLKNNLCVFDDNGYGATSYLVPYKVVMYSSIPYYYNEMLPEGIAYGRKYDDYANDQDWALYFAVKELK